MDNALKTRGIIYGDLSVVYHLPPKFLTMRLSSNPVIWNMSLLKINIIKYYYPFTSIV